MNCDFDREILVLEEDFIPTKCDPIFPEAKCQDLWAQRDCSLVDEKTSNIALPKGVCVCKNGFFRNSVGICVNEHQCFYR